MHGNQIQPHHNRKRVNSCIPIDALEHPSLKRSHVPQCPANQNPGIQGQPVETEIMNNVSGYIVASHLTWGSVITVAVAQTNGGLGDCGLPTMQGASKFFVVIALVRPLTTIYSTSGKTNGILLRQGGSGTPQYIIHVSQAKLGPFLSRGLLKIIWKHCVSFGKRQL